MSSTSQGRQAEAHVADYLTRQGYKIEAQNWRTRRCEIDIVARKKKCVYFVEVKHRSRADWGDGLAYITPRKLAQMRFAATVWMAAHDWQGETALLAISTGPDGAIEQIVDSF